MILPDTQAHLNGHAVITYTYNLFLDDSEENAALMENRQSKLHLESIDDPNYFGLITFELPDKLFNYTSGIVNKLSGAEIEQVIEFLTDIRNNPNLWTTSEF